MYWTQMCIRVQALQFFRFLLNGFIMYFGKLCSRRYSESSFFFNTQIRNSFATIANVSVFHLVHVLLDYRLAYLRTNIVRRSRFIYVSVQHRYLIFQASTNCVGKRCASSEYECHVPTNTCYYSVCQSNTECPGGMRCIQNHCEEQVCTKSEDCPLNQLCLYERCTRKVIKSNTI